MSPLRSQLHVDTLLSNVSVKHKNNAFVADQIFPIVPVKKRSDKYRVYARNFRLPETARSNGGVAREYMFEVSTAGYVLEWHAQKDYVTDRDAENYDVADLRSDTTEMLTDVINLRKEKMVADLFTSTSWSQSVSLAATAVWSLQTTVSDPVPTIDTGTSVVLANSGNKPNFMFMSRELLVFAKNHISILDRVKYTNAMVSEQILAGLFGFPSVLITNAQVDSSAYGATDSIAPVFPARLAFLGYKPASPGPLQPSCGYIFEYNRPLVKRWRDEEREAEAIEVNREFIPKIVSSLSGYLINATA